MKKRILLIALIGLSFGIKAQDETVNGNLTTTGSVGVGTTNFLGYLTLKDQQKFYLSDNNAVRNAFWMKQLGSTTMLIGQDQNGVFYDRVKITNLQIQLGSGQGNFPSYSFLNDTNTGMFNPFQDNLAFSIGGYEKMRILPNGNVGIGITNPTAKLEVVGDLKAIKAIFPGKELNNESFASWNDGIEKSIVFSAGKTIPGSSNIRLFSMHDMSMGSPYDFNGVIFSMYDRNGKKRFNVDMFEDQHTELVLKDRLESEFFKVKDYGTSEGAYIQMQKSNTKFIIGGTVNDPIIGTHKFVVKGSSLIQGNIITDSSIGIGTANPDEKLTVKGKIHAEEVRVDLYIPPDFVFQKYYTGTSSLNNRYIMPTLEEVETFTKKNYHLPEIPSAKEIKEKGLHLKEMTTLLLQKVEELTLYTIEQEKKIKKQQERIQKLEDLEKRLKKLESLIESTKK